MPGTGRQLSPAEQVVERMLEASDEYVVATYEARLKRLSEDRRRLPGHRVVFGYLRTNPRTSLTTHRAYMDQLEDAGCDIVRAERMAGNDLTEGFFDLVDHMESGDVLMIPRAYQLSRLQGIARRGVEAVEARGASVEYLYGVGPTGTA
ncbi:hypothetical protein YIM_47660 [Amycolatopsis sp. YIM 10]|nr:hypothetical protein YIM_47660 [Amycolatopsis sp. YIM 10]